LEFKILKVTLKISFNSSSETNPLGFTPVLGAVFHSDQSGVALAALPGLLLSQYDYRQWNPRAFTQGSISWVIDANDGDENQFSVIATSSTSSSFGGLWLYCDGPAVSVGQVPFSVVATSQVLMIGNMASSY
jgi:hypothetical protein